MVLKKPQLTANIPTDPNLAGVHLFQPTDLRQAALAAFAHHRTAGVAQEMRDDFAKAGELHPADVCHQLHLVHHRIAAHHTHVVLRDTKDENLAAAAVLIQQAAQAAHTAAQTRVSEAPDQPIEARMRRILVAEHAAKLRAHTVRQLRQIALYNDAEGLPPSLQAYLPENAAKVAAHFAQDDHFDRIAHIDRTNPEISFRETFRDISEQMQDIIDRMPHAIDVVVSATVRSQPRFLDTMLAHRYQIDECATAIFHPVNREAPTAWDIVAAFCYRGKRHIQSLADPFPPQYLADEANRILDVAQETLRQTEITMRDQNYGPHWQLMHRMRAAVNTGVHTMTDAEIDQLTTPLRQHQPPHPKGLTGRFIKAIALDNPLAAEFISRASAAPSHYAPSQEQAQAIIKAASSVGLDQHQLYELALHLRQDPPQLGVAVHPTNFNFLHDTIDVCDATELPNANLWVASKLLTKSGQLHPR